MRKDNDRKSEGPVGRDQSILELEKLARKKVSSEGAPAGAARPKDAGRSDGSGAPAAPDGGKLPPTSEPRIPNGADAGHFLMDRTVRAIRGYHKMGFMATGHDHWKEIPMDAIQSGAESFAGVLGRLPEKVQGTILVGLAYGDSLFAAVELLVAPAYMSWRIHQEEKALLDQPPATETDPATDDGPKQ